MIRAAPHERAGTDVFIEWFNEVWTGLPNELDDELAKPDPDPAAVEDLIARTRGWTPLFESLERCLKPADAYPLLCDWVRRVDALPRA